MRKNSSSWIEGVQNNIGLNGTFSGSVPSLDSLRLVQCVIRVPVAIKISLNFAGLPDGSPSRWQEKGYDSVQFRVAFYDVEEFSIAGDLQRLDGDVRVIFNLNKTVEIVNCEFCLKLKYGSVRVDVYPYNSRIFDEPRPWLP